MICFLSHSHILRCANTKSQHDDRHNIFKLQTRLNRARAGALQARARVRCPQGLSLYARLNSIDFNFHVKQLLKDKLCSTSIEPRSSSSISRFFVIFQELSRPKGIHFEWIVQVRWYSRLLHISKTATYTGRNKPLHWLEMFGISAVELDGARWSSRISICPRNAIGLSYYWNLRTTSTDPPAPANPRVPSRY